MTFWQWAFIIGFPLFLAAVAIGTFFLALWLAAERVEGEDVWIYDTRQDAYWMPAGQGYTADPNSAGTWTREEAEQIVVRQPPGALQIRKAKSQP